MLPRFAHFCNARLTVLATSSMPAPYVGFVEFSSHQTAISGRDPLGVVCAALTNIEEFSTLLCGKCLPIPLLQTFQGWLRDSAEFHVAGDDEAHQHHLHHFKKP